jgi:hypothetical protein
MTEPKRPVLKLKIPLSVPKPLKQEFIVPKEPLSTKPVPAKSSAAISPKAKPTKATPRKMAVTAKTANLMPNEEYKRLFKQVCTKYPKLFDINNKKIRVLAIGVRQEVVAKLGWSAKTGRDFFFIFCNSKKYKQARIKGANRYDLQGKVVGKVE